MKDHWTDKWLDVLMLDIISSPLNIISKDNKTIRAVLFVPAALLMFVIFVIMIPVLLTIIMISIANDFINDPDF